MVTRSEIQHAIIVYSIIMDGLDSAVVFDAPLYISAHQQDFMLKTVSESMNGEQLARFEKLSKKLSKYERNLKR